MKKILLTAMILILVCCFVACSGSGDWTYKLPNGYEVWRVNSNEILVIKTDSSGNGGEIKIPTFVKEFSYDERFVFSRNVDIISQNNIFQEVYYVLDTKEDKVYGPLDNIDDLKKLITELHSVLPEIWYRTSPPPQG